MLYEQIKSKHVASYRKSRLDHFFGDLIELASINWNIDTENESEEIERLLEENRNYVRPSEPLIRTERITKYYSVQEVAKMLTESVSTVRQLCKDGYISAKKESGKWRISEYALDKWLTN